LALFLEEGDFTADRIFVWSRRVRQSLRQPQSWGQKGQASGPPNL